LLPGPSRRFRRERRRRCDFRFRLFPHRNLLTIILATTTLLAPDARYGVTSLSSPPLVAYLLSRTVCDAALPRRTDRYVDVDNATTAQLLAFAEGGRRGGVAIARVLCVSFDRPEEFQTTASRFAARLMKR
jgi:hypothetical protein